MAIEVGSVIEGKVSGIMSFGAFVSLPENKVGLVHISEVSSTYVTDINQHLKVGDTVKVKVLKIDDNGKISLSIKKAQEYSSRRTSEPFSAVPAETDWSSSNNKQDMSFEDMMANFKQSSDARMLDIKRNTESKRGNRRK